MSNGVIERDPPVAVDQERRIGQAAVGKMRGALHGIDQYRPRNCVLRPMCACVGAFVLIGLIRRVARTRMSLPDQNGDELDILSPSSM